MLNFLIGLTCGIGASALFIFLVEMVVRNEEPYSDKPIEHGSPKLGEHGAVLEPKSEAVIGMEEMFARNDREGQDTELKDLI